MSSKKTEWSTTVLTLILLTATPAPIKADAVKTAERGLILQLESFATCAGRYSAMMEHQWLTYDAGSERSEALRAGFVDLIDAVLPAAKATGGLPDGQPLAWRIAAKAGLQVLLQRATFTEGRGAELAARQARHALGACRTLLLS